MPSGGARPGTGGKREGAGRKPKGERPSVQFQVKTDERVKAAFVLAWDDWHTETGGTQGEFLALILSESERVKGWGV